LLPLRIPVNPRATVKNIGWLAILAFLTGCGHPASVKECEEIVETIVRLELKEIDAGNQAVAEEVRDAKAAMRSDMMKQCVGRRITDAAMKCVRESKSAAHIETECFN
jgi:hypothetical protein